MAPPNRRSSREVSGMGRAVVERGIPGVRPSGSLRAQPVAQRTSAAVVLVFIFASTAISLYDLYLLITRLGW